MTTKQSTHQGKPMVDPRARIISVFGPDTNAERVFDALVMNLRVRAHDYLPAYMLIQIAANKAGVTKREDALEAISALVTVSLLDAHYECMDDESTILPGELTDAEKHTALKDGVVVISDGREVFPYFSAGKDLAVAIATKS